MRKTSEFSEVVEAAERLSLDEKETLLELLRNRTADERRAQLRQEVALSRREFANAKAKPATVEQLMREILK